MVYDIFWGEFLTSPSPLELSLNVCSHGCTYCFANLNTPNRKADLLPIMRLLGDFRNRTTLIATLMQQGYPVTFSNKVDPFAKSNYRQALPILEAMVAANVPVAMQTKGGYGVDEALEILPVSSWYVTMTTLDDEVRKRIEPGAPSVQERLDLIRKLSELGHYVTVGFNPYQPEWCADVAEFVETVKAAGAYGIWTECLHLNYEQVNNMTPRQKEAISLPLIERASKRGHTPALRTEVEKLHQVVRDAGLHLYSIGQSEPSGYFDAWREMYPNTYPVQQDFVNWAHSCLEDGDLITFDEWAELMCSRLPSGMHNLGGYIGASAVQVWRTHKRVSQMTFRQLLSIVWADARVKFCPARNWAFAWAGTREKEGWTQYVDDNGLPLLVFRPGLCGEYFTEV